MDTDLKSRRIDVLLRWRASIAEGPWPVPSEADLTKVGNAGTPLPPYVDRAALDPWADTIRFLIEQVALGGPDPVGRIPARLRSPRGRPGAGGPATPPPADDAPRTDGDSLLDRVRRWREQALHDDVPGAGELKPSMLRSIVNRGLRTAEDIAGGLPRSLAHLAPAIAEAMRGEATRGGAGTERSGLRAPRPRTSTPGRRRPTNPGTRPRPTPTSVARRSTRGSRVCGSCASATTPCRARRIG